MESIIQEDITEEWELAKGDHHKRVYLEKVLFHGPIVLEGREVGECDLMPPIAGLADQYCSRDRKILKKTGSTWFNKECEEVVAERNANKSVLLT